MTNYVARFILWAMALVMASSLVVNQAYARPATPVNVMKVVMTELFPTSWASGNVVSNNHAGLAAEVEGRLVFIAQIGDVVAKGDVVAQIDDELLSLALQVLIAEQQSLSVQHAFLVRETARKAQLFNNQLTSQTEFEQTQMDRDKVAADIAAGKARIAQTKQRLLYTKITAPFGGVVTERLSQLGEVVSQGSKVVNLVQTDTLEVSAKVPLTLFNFLTVGRGVSVSSALGQRNANIRAIVPVADARSHLIEVRLTLDQSTWPVGLDVRVAVPSGASQSVLAVPRDALVLRREGNAVFKINDKNIAEKVAVILGIGAGELIAVSGDLQPGDKVVVRGAERLQPGQAVSIKDNNAELVTIKSAQP